MITENLMVVEWWWGRRWLWDDHRIAMITGW